ncbi:MAG: acetylxylan esterase [Methylomonas sp.]|nr:acetylxylan esterase [Methylomonas sp.]
MAIVNFDHPFHFDPRYGYSIEQLLAVLPPQAPEDFSAFWQQRYRRAISLKTDFQRFAAGSQAGYSVYDIHYRSTDGFTIGGWLLEPEGQTVRQCLVVGHGYGGRDQPDYHFDIPETAYLFPCFRGLSRSRCARVSDQPYMHVLHDIDFPERYIIGGCVDDLWLGVSLMLELYPDAAGRIAYMGTSFGGGIGALAIPWDERIGRAHLNVPTFGCQALRLTLPTIGSGGAVADYVRQRGHVPMTLTYYDAAIAATFAMQPVHVAAALFDPMVAPPGQFGIYNAWGGAKQLFVLDAGHFDYPRQALQEHQLLTQIRAFFQD